MVRKCDAHESPEVSERAEKMIWPSEYRSMAEAYGAARRRRTRIAAKSPGEPPTGFDPGVSEWGNPIAWNGSRPYVNQ